MTLDEYKRFCNASAAIPSWLRFLETARTLAQLSPDDETAIDYVGGAMSEAKPFLTVDVPIIQAARRELCDVSDSVVSAEGASGSSAHVLSVKLIGRFWFILKQSNRNEPDDPKWAIANRDIIRVCKRFGLDSDEADRLVALLERERGLVKPAGLGVGGCEDVNNGTPGWITEILETVPVDLGTGDTINRRMFNEFATGDESIIDRSQREWGELLGCSHAAVGKTKAWEAILKLRERRKQQSKDKLAT